MNGYKNPRFREKLTSCLVSERYVTSGCKALQTNALPRPDDPWISPSVWDAQTLSRLPPMIVTNGGVETLLDEANTFIRRARQSKVHVEHFVLVSMISGRRTPERSLMICTQPDHPHDVGAIPWFYPSNRRMFRVVGQWIRSLSGVRQHA
jgi:acetyl esterase/lipase